MKREDFTFTANAEGYMIQYKGRNIGGAGINGKFKGQGAPHRGFATRAQEQASAYAGNATDSIRALLDGYGEQRFKDVIERIDKGEYEY